MSTMETIVGLVFLLFSLSGAKSESMRNLSEIRYHFTTCGKQGSSGPEFQQCVQEYSKIQSPITNEGLLVDIMRGNDYEGAQQFRVPRTGLYNVTVAGAAGGRGICSSTSGRGLRWKGTVYLSADEDLLVLVGQRGVGPCDQTAVRVQDLAMCHDPPTNLTEAQTCEQEWMAWINSYSSSYVNEILGFVGGGSGGGASFILPVTRQTETINRFPIVIAPGGGGSAAIECYDFFNEPGAVPSQNLAQNVSDEEQYLLLINAQTALDPSILGVPAGSRGYINSGNIQAIATLRPGAGGGWTSTTSGINIDGGVLGLQSQFAIGGQGCSERLANTIQNAIEIPIRNLSGGFGGGGGQCGGGGAGGGYTGGSVFGAARNIPSGGGYFLGPQSAPQGADYDNTSFIQLSIDLNPGEDGYVDIVPVNCGCAHDCTVYQDLEMFKCFCPSGFQLSPNEVDCFQGNVVNVSLLPSSQQGGIIFTPVELNSSYEIFGLSAVLESVGGTSGALWSCSIFLIGNNNEIVAITRPVRESGAATDGLARVNSSNVTNVNYQLLLRTSVTVTGALLASLGGCSITGMSLELNVSIIMSGSQALTREDYGRFDYSVARTLSSQLLPVQQPEREGANVTIIGTAVGVVVVLIMMILIGVVGCVLYARLKLANPEATYTQNGFSIHRNDAYGSYPIVAEGSENLVYYEMDSTNKAIIDLNYELPNISRHDLSLKNIIGEGEFGVVYRAEVMMGEKQSVAAKTIKGSLSQTEVDELKKEYRIMCQLKHPNVLTPICICVDAEVPYLIMPLMERGSLLMYLRREKDKLFMPEDIDEDKSVTARRRLLDMCYQTAKGMEYIASLNLIHRDLAARNCMIDRAGSIRVSDFGLAESIYTSTYVRVKNHKEVKLPIKWTAPESISYGIFSEKTDMWSFGVTCWEVFSAGKTPYPGIHPLTVINMIEEGYRMEKPKNYACTDTIYALMMECWSADSKNRPTFSDMVKNLAHELDQLPDFAIATI